MQDVGNTARGGKMVSAGVGTREREIAMLGETRRTPGGRAEGGAGAVERAEAL